MHTKSLVGLLALAVVLVGIASLFPREESDALLSQAQAEDAVIAQYPDLAAYRTTSLPPSAIEGDEAPDGWYVAFVQRGSGVPGILTAQCYNVTEARQVIAVGTYSRGTESVETLDLASCTPTAVQTTPDTVHPYGTVVLTMGEAVVFKDITMTPVFVVEDSRCPVDVQCIQAGTVRLKIEVQPTGLASSTSIVKLGEEFTTAGVRIVLSSVGPSKNSKSDIGTGEYRFTFEVQSQSASVPVNPAGKCYVGGCSAQLCSDTPDMASTCEYTESYACYKTATCERQSNGQCGWTSTSELQACLSRGLILQ